MANPIVPTGDAALQIGKPTLGPGTSEYLQGYIDDFRVTKGINRHAISTDTFYNPTLAEALIVQQDGNDDYWPQVSSLLHLNGTNGGTVFTDVKGKVFASTGTAGTATTSTVQSKFGGASLLLNGATTTSISTLNNADYNFGNGDFTVECWFRLTAYNSIANTILCMWDSAGKRTWILYVNTAFHISWSSNTDGTNTTSAMAPATASIYLNTWYHVAISRTGPWVNMFLDGMLIGTTTAAPIASTGSRFTVGNNYEAVSASVTGWAFNGYIDEIRITKGVGRYTTNFTVQSAAFPEVQGNFGDPYYTANTKLLVRSHGANGSTSFVDESPSVKSLTPLGSAQMGTPGAGDPYFGNNVLLLTMNGIDMGPITDVMGHTITVNGFPRISAAQSKFGGTSGIFNGSSDFLILPASTDFDFGILDFTIECWLYPVSIPVYAIIFTKRQNNTAFSGFEIYLLTSGAVGVAVSIDGATWGLSISSTTVLALNTWSHVAVVRSGNTYKIFINGVLDSTIGYFTGSHWSNSFPPTIGADYDVTYAFNGYMDDYRITKGIARYTDTFGDLSYNQVSLLLHFDGANTSTVFTDNSPGARTITVFGNAQISTAQSKWSGSSGLFDGTGDYLSVPTGQHFNFGSNPFTIEFWAYPTAVGGGSIRRYFSLEDTNNTIIIREEASLIKAVLRLGSTAVQNVVGNVNFTLNTWQHIALCRITGNVFNLYKDGVLIGTLTVAGAIDTSTITAIIGGTPTAEFMTGYIDDLRVTKGVARYTSGSNAAGSPSPPSFPYPNFSSYIPPLTVNSYVGGITAGPPGPSFPAISLSGPSDAISVGSSADFNFGNLVTPFTIDFWLFPTSLIGKPWIYQFEIDINNRWGMYIEGGILKLSFVSGGIEMIYNSTQLIVANTLYYIEFNYTVPQVNNTQIRLYVNGNSASYFIPTSGKELLINTLLNKQSQVNKFAIVQSLDNSVNRPTIYSGMYKIAGTTKKAGSIPYPANVLVFPDESPGLCVASARTDSITGTFVINNLAAGKYIVVGLDPTGSFNDATYDHVTSVPM